MNFAVGGLCKRVYARRMNNFSGIFAKQILPFGKNEKKPQQ
jgi:hypothetical protein